MASGAEIVDMDDHVNARLHKETFIRVRLAKSLVIHHVRSDLIIPAFWRIVEPIQHTANKETVSRSLVAFGIRRKERFVSRALSVQEGLGCIVCKYVPAMLRSFGQQQTERRQPHCRRAYHIVRRWILAPAVETQSGFLLASTLDRVRPQHVV